MQQPKAQPPYLSNWRDWGLEMQAGPRIVSELGRAQDKHVNAVYLISDGANNFVLKQYAQNPAQQSIDQHWRSIDTWQNTIAHPPYSLAPAVLYRHSNNHYVVFEYIDGKTQDTKVAPQPSLLNTLCQSIHRYHSLPMQWPKAAEPYTRRCENYLDIANKHLDKPLLNKFEQGYGDIRDDCMRHLQLDNAPPVCCHNDLNPGNIICLRDSSGATSIRILDWDFASPGIAAMDFASLGVELGVDCKQLATMAGLDRSQLAAAYRVYAFICDIYKEILRAAKPNPPKPSTSL